MIIRNNGNSGNSIASSNMNSEHSIIIEIIDSEKFQFNKCLNGTHASIPREAPVTWNHCWESGKVVQELLLVLAFQLWRTHSCKFYMLTQDKTIRMHRDDICGETKGIKKSNKYSHHSLPLPFRCTFVTYRGFEFTTKKGLPIAIQRG